MKKEPLESLCCLDAVLNTQQVLDEKNIDRQQTLTQVTGFVYLLIVLEL